MYSSHQARLLHEKSCPWNPDNKTLEAIDVPVPDLDESISGPKRIITDISVQQASEPETSQTPPSKMPRIESAAEPPQASPPEPQAGAEEPSSLLQPLTQELAVPPKLRRTLHPAIKAAKQRLKRSVTKRSLAPLAGGMTQAKQMLSELDQAARLHGMETPATPPTVATTETVPERQASSMTREHAPEHSAEEAQSSKKARTDPDLQAPGTVSYTHLTLPTTPYV